MQLFTGTQKSQNHIAIGGNDGVSVGNSRDIALRFFAQATQKAVFEKAALGLAP